VGAVAWRADPNGEGGFLIQWLGIEDESEIDRVLGRTELVGALAETIHRVEFSIGPSGLMRLFDSAEPGDDIQGDNELIELKPGGYQIRAAYFGSASMMIVAREVSRM
jgi:hypothetical protein